MKKITPPTITVSDTISCCITSKQRQLKNKDLVTRIKNATQPLSNIESEYKTLAPRKELHTLQEQKDFSGLTQSELKNLYESVIARGTSPHHHIYETILSAAKHKICPYCGAYQVGQLDHYLPKEKFSALAITPANLVPACERCNKKKLATFHRDAEKQFIHPYFDDIDEIEWLYATAHEEKPTYITFFTSPPDTTDETTKERIAYHFKTLKINEIYTANAASELAGERDAFLSHINHGGPADLKNYLEQRYSSFRASSKNSWQTAYYRALSSSDWICATDLADKLPDPRQPR